MPEDGVSYHSRYYGRQRYRGLGGVEPSGFRIGENYAGVAAQPPTLISHGTTFAATAQFRSIAAADEGNDTYVAIRNDEVLFQQPQVHEVEPTSAVHLAAQASSKPMRVENEEFFRFEQHLFEAKLKEMTSMIVSRKYFKPPNKETLSILASAVRLFVDWTVKFWRLNRDAENRMRFTRALQNWMHMQCAVEAFLLAEILKSHDSDSPRSYQAKRSAAFQVRNTFRIFVKNMGMYDRLYHWGFQVSNNRLFDFLSQFPVFSTFTSFPPTENVVNSRNMALNSILRNLARGTLAGRRISGNRQDLVTDNPNAYAQNLAPEESGLETANRQQYGTYIGRRKTNAFRLEHRLQTDESIIHTFSHSPATTMLNNGVEHVLSCLCNHWKNTLYQENGNFGHQRQELLDPIQTLRFHMPIVLVTLTNLRGRNNFDAKVLGPLIKRLESFDPGVATIMTNADMEMGDRVAQDITRTCTIARQLVASLLEHAGSICAAIPQRMTAFQGWLQAIDASIDLLEKEAHGVQSLVASVDRGIRMGYQLIKLTNWEIPKDSILERGIVAYLSAGPRSKSTGEVDCYCIAQALSRLAPRDARTLQDLFRTGHGRTRPARLLVGRVRTLLHRELRRKAVDQRIRELSRGEILHEKDLRRNDWYVVEWKDANGLFQYIGSDGTKFKFKELMTGNTILMHKDPTLVFRYYVPVAEAISRAQKTYMNLELEYLKRFSYNAFMEFGSGDVDGSLRTQLRRLVVVAQLHSYEIDNSRRMILSKFLNPSDDTVNPLLKGSRPQNVIVIGGGPTGLMTAIHCLQNCLMSGGTVTLYESRDTYEKEAAAFERAQVVRLDSRWISMLRFHLGTAFEDQLIPLRGETDAHMGNTIPLQGFVELTIKSMETALHEEAIRLRSKGLMKFYMGSGIDFDVEKGIFTKKGAALKVGDNIRIDGMRYRVAGHIHPRPLGIHQIFLGQVYDIFFPREDRVGVYRLVEAFPEMDIFGFEAVQGQIGLPSVLKGSFQRYKIFPRGLAKTEPLSVTLKQMDGGDHQKTIDFGSIKDEIFQIDVYDSHVLIAAGKPKNSDEHFAVTTNEPYGVCCIEGLKVSMLMHLFGEKRFDVGKFNSGYSDDMRSQDDQNTRLVGDFTKTVALPPIIITMAKRLGISRGDNVRTTWVKYIDKVVADAGVDYTGLVNSLNEKFKELIVRANYTESIVSSKLTYNNGTSIPPARLGFQRQRLQTRYFEVGDNYYLGMELPREFEYWKQRAIYEVLPYPEHSKLRKKLYSVFDRLWFEATIDVVNRGDVFNPDGRFQIPTFHLIPSLSHVRLGELQVGEAFTLASPSNAKFEISSRDEGTVRLVAPNQQEFSLPGRTRVRAEDGSIRTAAEEGMTLVEPVDMFEILAKFPSKGFSLVRSSEGCVFELPDILPAWRQSDLARSVDGFSESKNAIATFPVALKVNVRTLRILRVEGTDGYITAFIGDAQASPHFMRYSALTGASVNAMSFNNFIAQATAGVSFVDRVRRYALETNWSNGEVVERGTGHNFGEDGFCRPAFTYKNLIDYIFSRNEEHYILGEDLDTALSRDWKYKISAGLVPRGLEDDDIFRRALQDKLIATLQDKFIDKAEDILELENLDNASLQSITMSMQAIGERFKNGIERDPTIPFMTLDPYTSDCMISIATVMQGTVEALKQTMDYAYELRTKNARVSSELINQPKSVDSFIDDFAIEAQMFANGLTQSVAFAAGSVALGLLGTNDRDPSRFVSVVLSALNINTSFGTMTNVSRYRNRNEEARVIFFDEKLPRIMKGVFSLMSAENRRDPAIPNPFVEELQNRVDTFFYKSRYYEHEEAAVSEFRKEYQDLLSTIQSPRSVVHFMKRLLRYFIVDKFQANPYLQDELIEMYKTLNEMLHLMRQKHSGGHVEGAFDLYHELLIFRPKLEKSLQRGTIRFGFLKRRPWHQWSLFVAIRYILSSICFYPTMNTETKRVLRKLKAVSAAGEGVFLRREVRDFQELYYAGKESEITSLLFCSATIVFYASFFFTLFGLIALAAPVENGNELKWETLQFLLDLSGFTSIFSIIGATLATFHQGRMIRILSRLHKRLGQGRQVLGRLRLVRYLTRSQQFLSFSRIAITLTAAVSLIWSLRLRTESSGDMSGKDGPIYVALVAVVAGIITVVLFFIIELSVRYGLDPNLGPLVLEPFMEEIQKMKRRFVDPRAGGVGIETAQNIEREICEYTAREFIHRYRFDAVFPGDSFGSIFHYLQAGAPRRKVQT